MMELQKFVSTALKQIVKGVADAQKAIEDDEGEIAPRYTLGKDRTGGYIYHGDESQQVFKISFDVAVTATEGTKTSGGVGVVAGVFALGSQGKSDNSTAVVSRLKFEVPVVFSRGKHPQNKIAQTDKNV